MTEHDRTVNYKTVYYFQGQQRIKQQILSKIKCLQYFELFNLAGCKRQFDQVDCPESPETLEITENLWNSTEFNK